MAINHVHVYVTNAFHVKGYLLYSKISKQFVNTDVINLTDTKSVNENLQKSKLVLHKQGSDAPFLVLCLFYAIN